MQTLAFFRYSSLILLCASLVLVVTLVGLALINAVSAPEFRDLASAVVPGMSGYIPPALAFALGDVKIKVGEIWRPLAITVFFAYLLYFLVVETCIILYAVPASLNMDSAKLTLTTAQSIFGFFIGGVFVKKLSARAR
ncbi:UNVERIFIED_ORG: hypothetical protein J2Y81_001954 [Paraburkholderia sediminicola]|nr:hypothetical protein [Paraburkholderia sediminicola]